MLNHKDDFLELEQYVDRNEAEWFCNIKMHEATAENKTTMTELQVSLMGSLVQYMSAKKLPVENAKELMADYLCHVDQCVRDDYYYSLMEDKHVKIM